MLYLTFEVLFTGVKRDNFVLFFFFLYFRPTDAKARLAKREEREKNNACTHAIVQAVPTFKYECDYPRVHVRYINILTWLRGFQDKLPYLVLFFFLRIQVSFGN